MNEPERGWDAALRAARYLDSAAWYYDDVSFAQLPMELKVDIQAAFNKGAAAERAWQKEIEG